MEPVSIKNINLYRYDLPLITPLVVADQKILNRSGFIIELSDKHGNAGYGDISPLPGLHAESLSDCLTILKNNISIIKNTPIPENIPNHQQPLSLPPSVAFGLDMAKLGLISAVKGEPIQYIINDSAPDSIKINALLTRNMDNDVEQIKSWLQQGYTTIKIKVGGNPVDTEIDRIHKIQQTFKNIIVLRLDANRAWSFKDASTFIQNINTDNIEYIEEPLTNPLQLQELADQVAVPIALDESLTLFNQEETPLPDWVRAIILKPAVLGPLSNTLLLADKAKRQNIKSIITSVFDSGLALQFYARLSAALSGPDTAAGLDTWRWLNGDAITPPFKTENGKYGLAGNAPELNHSILQRMLL